MKEQREGKKRKRKIEQKRRRRKKRREKKGTIFFAGKGGPVKRKENPNSMFGLGYKWFGFIPK
jgi:hypothetical protein